MVIDFKYRIDATKIYLSALRRNSIMGYKDILEKLYDSSEIGDKLTLLHPAFIKSIKLPDHISHDYLIKKIQGSRTFLQENGKCQAKMIWGYECDVDYEFCHGDHLFPYSLGGPTISSNKLLLCHYHNMVKGTDIHLLPWEDGNRFSWVNEHLNKLKTAISIYL